MNPNKALLKKKLNRTGKFVDENVLNKTGMSVYINFMPVLLFNSLGHNTRAHSLSSKF